MQVRNKTKIKGEKEEKIPKFEKEGPCIHPSPVKKQTLLASFRS